ncbi:MAG: gfo/Idh/MocA family oxidoreductase, partial [Blautia obeum]|nr:gfo/Idh/MocA family oxidoreductase [Blautia obeum]
QIEAVYVASPVCFHKKQALEVLHAGKSLLLEKPLAMNEEDAREIVQTALKKGQTAGVAMVMKHHPAHRKMKKLIESGVIGDIVSCRAQLNCWFPDMEGNWRQKKATAGGGALVDMGTHCIDILKYLLDDHVEWVFGDIGTRTFSYEVDDSADCILHMKKGATCYIDVHFNIPDEAAKGMLEIYGTKGSLLASGTIGQDGQGEVYLNQCATEGYDSNQKRKEDGLGQKVDYERENIYGRQIEEFSKAIEEGLTVSTSFEDAFETVKIIDALYKSSKEKKAVYL